jgi:hypothetical protein
MILSPPSLSADAAPVLRRERVAMTEGGMRLRGTVPTPRSEIHRR